MPTSVDVRIWQDPVAGASALGGEDLSSCRVNGAHLPGVHTCPLAFVNVTYILRRSTVPDAPARWPGCGWLRPLLVIALCQPLDWHGIQWCPRVDARSFRLIG